VQHALFHPRQRSLARGNTLVLGSLAVAMWLSHFPHLRPNALLLLPTLGCAWGTFDTARCMQRRWNFYHGGVLLCLYMDLMAGTMVLFFLIYPYFLWFSEGR